jgi:hypothetical protein
MVLDNLQEELVGQVFKEGFNPFSNVNFSGGIMSGLGQTFTSPISGAPMFGQSQFAPDTTINLHLPNKTIASGTSRASDQFGSKQDYLAQTLS